MNGPTNGGSGERRPSAGAAGREARFLAPGPLSIEASLKRNIPQAMTGSASTLSDKVNAEFEAQALYIIDMMQKRSGGKDAGEDGPAVPTIAPADVPNAPESLLDPSDRVDGYRRYRRWVDNGLELWKVRRRRMTALTPSPSSMPCASPSSPTHSLTWYTTTSSLPVSSISASFPGLGRPEIPSLNASHDVEDILLDQGQHEISPWHLLTCSSGFPRREQRSSCAASSSRDIVPFSHQRPSTISRQSVLRAASVRLTGRSIQETLTTGGTSTLYR